MGCLWGAGNALSLPVSLMSPPLCFSSIDAQTGSEKDSDLPKTTQWGILGPPELLELPDFSQIPAEVTFPSLHATGDRDLSIHRQLLTPFLNRSDGYKFLLLLQSQL